MDVTIYLRYLFIYFFEFSYFSIGMFFFSVVCFLRFPTLLEAYLVLND